MRTYGTTLECFMDLMERIPQEEHLEKRRILAQLLGVEDATVRRWMTGPSTPVGMSMISLRYYLDYLGYQVIEIARLSSLIQDASRLLAFRVMSLEDMARLTGHEEYPDQLLAVLRGVRGLSAERETQLRDLVTAYQQEFAEKLAAVPRLITMKGKVTPPASEVFGAPSASKVVQLTTATTVRPTPNNAFRRDERFKGLVLNLLDFARFYTDPEVPEEVRDQLRSVVGQQNIFDLKNLLARLCSSKAFGNQQ